jgi:uncharacterized protein
VAKLNFNLVPVDNKFFTLFEQSAELMVKAANKLQVMIHSWENVSGLVAEIDEIEHNADSVTHQIMYQLNRTFITPFDREDIALLAHSLDDVTDYIQATADTMFLYKIKAPANRAKELADIIVQIAGEVEKALPKLRQHNTQIKKILEICVEINRLENVADDIFHAALAELFENSSDIVEVIKWREIYEQMELATDRCEDVANVLEGVALKNA